MRFSFLLVINNIDRWRKIEKNKKIFKKIFCFEKFLHIKYENVINKNSKNLLCKSYNKVFLVFKTRINTKCSALTRAGMSRIFVVKPGVCWFRPHKGGYVVLILLFLSSAPVPPSQGRVCRLFFSSPSPLFRSALTRAGIKLIILVSLLYTRIYQTNKCIYRTLIQKTKKIAKNNIFQYF